MSSYGLTAVFLPSPGSYSLTCTVDVVDQLDTLTWKKHMAMRTSTVLKSMGILEMAPEKIATQSTALQLQIAAALPWQTGATVSGPSVMAAQRIEGILVTPRSLGIEPMSIPSHPTHPFFHVGSNCVVC